MIINKPDCVPLPPPNRPINVQLDYPLGRLGGVARLRTGKSGNTNPCWCWLQAAKNETNWRSSSVDRGKRLLKCDVI